MSDTEKKVKLSDFERQVRRAEQSKICKQKKAAAKLNISLEDYQLKLERAKKSPEEVRLIRNKQSRESKARKKTQAPKLVGDILQ